MVVCAFASFNTNAQTPDDDTILTIDSGRLVAMLDQVSALMKLPEVEQPPSQNPTEVLGFVVARYKRLLHVACERSIVEGPRCSDAYAPYLQPEPVPFPVLRREVNDAQDHVLPFWQAVCAELDDAHHRTCGME
ncbi:MAG TPA: hypothetical protein VIM56_07655 [Rhizomicrobium sp.]